MRRRLIAVLGVVTLFLLGIASGGAYAYFKTRGSGSGVIAAGTPAKVHVQAVASGTPATKLLPAASGDLIIQVQNPNVFSVTIFAVAQSGSVSAVGTPGCTGTNSGVTVPTRSGLTITVPAGQTSVLAVPNGASMSATSASACQGASFDIPVTISVER
jgi:hypothetical protein